MNQARAEIPSISTLVAFEATARLGGVRRAASELNTSPAAISRYIRNLEATLQVRLFERKHRHIALTRCGQEYYSVVKSSLDNLRAASFGIRAQESMLTIGCTQEISVLLLLPVFSKLKRSLPDGVNLRIVTCDYDMLSFVVPTGVDIIFQYSLARTDDESMRIIDDQAVPVATPPFRKRYEESLAGHPRHWSEIPRLDVAPRGQPWITWADWFADHDCDPPPAPVEMFENYVHLLEAAANGDGMAIGWNGFVNGYFESGRLVPLRNAWMTADTGLYAVLTTHGRMNSNARNCLTQLASLGRERVSDLDLEGSQTRMAVA